MEFDALYKIKVKMFVIDSSIFAMIIQWMQPARPFHRYRKWSQQNYLYYHDDTFRVWVFVWLHDDNCPLCLRGRGRCVYMGVPRLPCVMVEWCARIKYLDTLSATIFITMLAWTAAGQRARQRRPAICLHQTGIIHRRACAHASSMVVWCVHACMYLELRRHLFSVTHRESSSGYSSGIGNNKTKYISK